MLIGNEYLTTVQFANLIGVHPQTVRRWYRDGSITPALVTPGGLRLFSHEQVKTYRPDYERPKAK